MAHDIKANKIDVKGLVNKTGERIAIENIAAYLEDYKTLADLDLVHKKYIDARFGELSTTDLAEIFFDNIEAIKNIGDYVGGVEVVDLETAFVYRYNVLATEGVQPNDNAEAEGRWVEIGDLGAYNSPLRIVNIEEGSNIILDADSGNTYYRYKGASPITVTIPNTIPLALPFAINQMGVGAVTLQGASGVVLTTANLTSGGQGFGVTIMKVENNLVDVIGGVE